MHNITESTDQSTNHGLERRCNHVLGVRLSSEGIVLNDDERRLNLDDQPSIGSHRSLGCLDSACQELA